MLQIKRSQLKMLAKNRFGVEDAESQNKILIMLSVSLAARTSYTVVGDEKEVDYNKMSELHDRLLELHHMSPFEHCCLCVSEEEYKNSYKGQEEGWFRNCKGFKSYRQIIEES